MTKGFGYALALAIPIGALLLLSSGMPPSLVGANDGFTYDTAAVTYGPIRKLISTSGPVRALVTVSVGSQLSGQIRELKADFNSEVKAGDELAVIDDKTFVAKVAQARADLSAAKAVLASQEAALIKMQAIDRNAVRLMSRQQTLASKGVTASITLDNAIRDAEVAAAEVVLARAQAENARATIAQREALLAQAEIDLERTRVRSPIDGTVIARTVDIGQTVAASLQAPELFKIAQDLRRICIEAQVSEADVGEIAAGNAVEFSVDAYPQRRFRGRVAQVRLGGSELNNVVTYTVIIDADNHDRTLLPGMTANAKIEAARLDRALRLPNDALRFKPRGAAASLSAPNQTMQRELDRAKKDLALTEEQAAKVSNIIRGTRAEPWRAAGSASAAGSGETRAAPEGLTMQRVTIAVASVITDAQRSAFDHWKARREVAESRRSRGDVAVWILSGSGQLESRIVDLGMADDHFSELIGEALTEGDRLVLRSREVSRR